MIPCFSRDKVEYRFADNWFDIREVRERLHHLWIDYEHSVASGETLTGWWLYRFDPTMSVLASRYGPMRDSVDGEVREFTPPPAPADHDVRQYFEIDLSEFADAPDDTFDPDLD